MEIEKAVVSRAIKNCRQEVSKYWEPDIPIGMEICDLYLMISNSIAYFAQDL